jgi:transcriptional regulator with XRE-family HTH domain
MKLDKLKKMREQNKITQKEMSNKLKIPLGTYRHYEQGTREIKIQKLKEIAAIFKCTVDELI